MCASSSVYLPSSWVSHFSPLTHSHLSPRVNIYTLRSAESFGEHQDVQTVHCMRCTHTVCALSSSQCVQMDFVYDALCKTHCKDITIQDFQFSPFGSCFFCFVLFFGREGADRLFNKQLYF